MKTLIVEPPLSKLVAVTAVVIYFVLGSSTGLQLDPEGNYHITVGIRGDDPKVTETYVANIKVEISKLSDLLYVQSDGKFLINSVKILLPPGWAEYVGQDSLVIPGTGESFHESDIKISPEYLIPEVIRPTQCGHPGEVLKLPYDFFETDPTNATLSYRAKDKTLLHLWAEYRWGAFEEFGFPDNPRFPYLVKQQGQTEWEVSSCTNERVEGSFQFPNGTTCSANDEDFPPEPDCSFNPGSNSLIQSSLMSQFYWLDSMDSFCTSDNHNKYLPNRHNLFCGYQSVQQVLQNSLDWTLEVKKTPKNSKQFSQPEYTIVKPVEKPLVYLLIDSRNMAIPISEVGKIRTELAKLFDPTSGLDSELVLAIASYPGSVVGPDDEFQFYQELIPWTVLSNQRTNFTSILQETISQGENSADGFFGLGIKEIGSLKIKPRKHDQGTFLFVLKSSPTTNYDVMPFEEDVLSSLQGQKVKLFCVEVSSSNVFDKGVNLKRLAEETGGAHLTLTTSSDIETKLPGFIGDFVKGVNSGGFDRSLSTTVFKNLIQSTETTQVNFTTLGLQGTVKLTLTSDLPILSYSVKNTFGEEVELKERPEWEEQLGRGRRTTYFSNLTMDADKASQGLIISFQCSGVCTAFLTITFERGVANPYEASVSSSAFNGYFDAAQIPSGVLSIYAQVEHGGIPLINLGLSPPEASATLCSRSAPQRCWSVPLSDNGAGFPDLISNDGILSGGWVPPEDGQFYSWISINYKLPSELFPRTPGSYPDIHQNMNLSFFLGKYLGEGDSPLPCSVSGEPQNCIGFTPDSGFDLVADLPGFITVVNSDLFQGGVPTRIMDLEILEAEGSQVTLRWTTPTVFLPGGQIARAESYELKYCTSFDAALDLFQTCTPIDELGNPETEPGGLQTFTYEMGENDQTYYFGIWSLYQQTFSEVSNIVWQRPNKRPVTLPPPTSPTTPGTTDPDPGTTDPDPGTTDLDPGTTDPNPGTTDPDPGTTDPDPGTTDPDPGTTDPDPGTTDLDPGTTDPNPGTTDPDPGTTDPDPSTTDPNPGTTDPDPGTTDPDPSTTDPNPGTTNPDSGSTEPDSSTTESNPETTDPDSSTTEPDPGTTTDNLESTTENESFSPSDSTPIDPTTPPLSQSTTQVPITTTPFLQTTEPSVYFFKRPAGYITAGAISLVAITGVGGLVGYLCWKRHVILTKANLLPNPKPV